MKNQELLKLTAKVRKLSTRLLSEVLPYCDENWVRPQIIEVTDELTLACKEAEAKA
jgi:hypothetical protein